MIINPISWFVKFNMRVRDEAHFAETVWSAKKKVDSSDSVLFMFFFLLLSSVISLEAISKKQHKNQTSPPYSPLETYNYKMSRTMMTLRLHFFSNVYILDMALDKAFVNFISWQKHMMWIFIRIASDEFINSYVPRKRIYCDTLFSGALKSKAFTSCYLMLNARKWPLCNLRMTQVQISRLIWAFVVRLQNQWIL